MSSGLYSHTTRGVGTVLTAAIYNADHVNHVTNHNPSQMGGYSDSVAEMQNATSPGGLGSEVLASNLADELAHLRFVIARITGETHWYEAPVTSLATIGGGTPLSLAFASTPLTLRRTENDTTEREIISHQSGSGAGNKYSKRLVGSGSNAVAEVREYIGSVEMLRRTATLLTHQLATHINGYLGVGASGVDLIKLFSEGYIDIKKLAAPANPAADHVRLYIKDDGGQLRLAILDQSGGEILVGDVPPALDDVRLGTQASTTAVVTTAMNAPTGNVMTGITYTPGSPDEITIRYKPLQQKLVDGSYVTVSG